jgi:hypothetical protein
MAQTVSIQNEDINSIVGGGAVALLTPSTTNYYNLYSSSATAITGAVTVSASATPAGFVVFNMLLSTSFTFSGGGAFTFFGTSVSEGYMKAGTLFQATYNGSAYTVTILPSFSQSGFIQGSDIADTTIALTKLANGTSGNIIVYNGSQVPTSVTMSNDATISNTGALTISNNAVTAAKIASDAVTTAKILDANVTLAKLEASLQAYFGTPNTILYEEVTILSAAIKTGSTVPIVLVGAVAGKTILPLYVIEQMTYGTTPYATNGITEIKHDGATDPIFSTTANGFLFGTVSKSILMTLLAPTAATDTQLLVNADLLWTVNGGDPTAGDSNITVKVGYVLI